MGNEEIIATSENIFSKIRRHWRGEGTLAWAYWGFHFGGSLLLPFVLAVAFLFLLPFAYSPERPIQHSPIFHWYVLFASITYLVYVIASVVMVWRCGDNARWPGWKYLSRAAILSWAGNLVIYLVFNLL